MKVTARKLQKAKTTFKVLFFAFATIFSLSIFTCTPGLGNQVDTKAPSVVITSPATKSTLNGSFTVTGTASDDLAVTSVELYFTNISTSVQYGPYPATVGSNGTWSLSITPRSGSSSILPDGDYNIKAMAYDKSQHSGQTDVVYTIDTTPPTVMLTSPTTYSITPEFSKTITIKGEVYDASSLSSVWVYITDKNGVIKATTLAEGTNTFIASFSREQLTALVDYDGTKNTLYYYYAVATDIGGNKNTYDFHRGDIASILQGATSFPSINSIGYVDQGKSSDLGNGINTDSLDGIKKNIINARNAVALVGTDGVSYPHLKYSQTEQNKIQWINVTGRSEIDNGTLTEIEDTIPVGFAVTGTVLPTSDESTQQNFQVYLRKLTATEIAALNTVNPATGKITTSYLDTLNIETDEYSIPSTTDSSAAANTQGYFKMVGSSFSLEIKSKNPADPSSTDWTSGCYWIKIVYETDSGSQLQDEALFNISSEAPILHESGFAGEENQASGYYRGFMTAATKTAGTNKLSGYAANSSETDAVGSLVIVRPDGSTQDAPDSYITDLTSADKFKYSYIIDYDTDGSDDGEKTYTIVADNQTRIQRAVVIDTTSPEISFSNISEDENNLTILDSTSYTIRGTALDDNGIANIYYRLFEGETEKTEGWTSCSTNSSFAISSLDTVSAFKESTTYTVKIKAVDSAGNSSESEATFTFDARAPIATISSPSPQTGSTYYLSTSRTISFEGVASDSVYTAGKDVATAELYYIDEDDEKHSIIADVTRTLDDGTWKWTYSYTFPADGNYTVYIEATDGAGKTKTDSLKVKIDTEPPVITLSNVTPVVEIETEDGTTSYKVNGRISVKFVVDDETAIGNITYKINGGDAVAYQSGDSITIDTSGYSETTYPTLQELITITASDRCGNTVIYPDDYISEGTDTELKQYAIDQTSDRPTVSSSSLENLANINAAGVDSDGVEHNIFAKTAKIPIELSDDDKLYTLYVKLDGAADWTQLVRFNTRSTTYYFPFRNSSPSYDLAYGRHSIQFRIEDENYVDLENTPYSYSESEVYYIAIDDASPTLNISTTSGQFQKAQFTISGTANDTNGIAKIELISYGMNNDGSSDGTEHVFHTVTPGTGVDTTSSWIWSQAYNLESTNNEAGIKPYPANIKVRATDKIGRTTEQTFTYIYDNVKPGRPKFVQNAVYAEDINGTTYDINNVDGQGAQTLPDNFAGYDPNYFATTDVPFVGAFIEGYVANTKNTITILGTIQDPGDATTASGISDVKWGLVEGYFEHETVIVAIIPNGDGTYTFYEYENTLANAAAWMSALQAYASTGSLTPPAGYTAHSYDPSSKYYYAVPGTGGLLNFCYYYTDETLETIYNIINTGTDASGQHARKFGWTNASLNTDSSAWKVETAMPEFTSGSYTIMFVSHDKVGNESSPLVHYIIADNVAPSLTLDAYDDTSSTNTTVYISEADENGYITLNGTITDVNPLAWPKFSALEYIRAVGDVNWRPYLDPDPSVDGTGTEIGGITHIDQNPSSATYGQSIGSHTVDIETNASWTNEPWTWKVQLPSNGNSGYLDTTYIVDFSVKDKAYYDVTPTLNCSSVRRTIVVDRIKPEITRNSISPVINYNGEDCLNGTATIRVSVSDLNLASAYVSHAATKTYSLSEWATEDAADGDLYGTWTAFSSTQLASGWTDMVDTTNSDYYFTSGGKQYLALVFKAIDKAGNVAYFQLNHVINQDADKPTITPTNLTNANLENEDGAGWFNDGTTRVNVFEKTGKMDFSINDDDGVRYVYVKLDDAADWTGNVISGTVTSGTWSYMLSDLSYGKHKMQFYVQDINGTDSDPKTFYIAIDDGAPNLTCDTIAQFVPRSPTITGHVYDYNGVDKVTLVYTDNNAATQTLTIDLSTASTTSSTSPATWSSENGDIQMSLSDTGTMYVYAYDKIGNKRALEGISYRVDEVAPTVSITSVAGNTDWTDDTTTYVERGTSPRIITTLVDNTSTNVSGPSMVYYQISASSEMTSLTNPSSANLDSENAGTYYFDVVLTDYSGLVYVYVAGKDNAGNWSNLKKVPVSVDAAAPSTTISLDTNSVITGATAITGTATDDMALSSIRLVWRDTGDVIGTQNISGTQANWSITIPADATEGSREVTFTVTDLCGRSVDYSRTYKVDRSAPTVTFTNIDDADGSDATIETAFTNTQSSLIKVNLGYSDSIAGVSTLAYTFQRSIDGGTTFADYVYTVDGQQVTAGGTKSLAGSTSGTAIVYLSDFLLGQVSGSTVTTDGIWRIRVNVTDLAENTREIISPVFWIDQNKPSLEISEDSTGKQDGTRTQAIGNSFALSGTVSDLNYGQVNKVEVSIYNASYTAAEEEQFSTSFTSFENGAFSWSLSDETSPFLYDGRYTITVVAYDKAGNEKQESWTVACDKDAPPLTFTRPYSMTVSNTSLHSSTSGNANDVMGTISVAAQVPTDGEDGGMSKIYYNIGKANSLVLYDADGQVLVLDPATGFIETEGVTPKIASVRYAPSTGGTGISGSTQDPATGINGYWATSSQNWSLAFDFNAVSIVNNSLADLRADDDGSETKWRTYVYVIAVDIAGNINAAIYPINIDTNSDKPIVTIHSPDPELSASDNVYGGAFTVMGSVTDDNSVAKVYMQVVVEDGNYDEYGVLRNRNNQEAFIGDYLADWNFKDANGNTVDSYFGKKIDLNVDGFKGAWYEVADFTSSETTTATWRLKINNRKVDIDNTNGEVSDNENGSYRIFDNRSLMAYYSTDDGHAADDQSTITIRVVALDTKSFSDDTSSPAVFGEVSEVHVNINAGAPSIDLTELPEADEFISGAFDYRIELADDSNIVDYSVIATGTGGSYSIATGTNAGATKTISGTLNSADLASRCGSTVTITVSATDDNSPAPLTSTVSRRFFIDNTAPNFANAKVNGTVYETYLVPSAIDSDSLRDSSSRMRVGTTEAIFNGYVKEESGGSGIDYVMVYFTRGTGANTKYYSVASYESIDTTGTAYAGTATMLNSEDENVTVYLPVTSLAAVDKNKQGITYSGGSYASGTRTPYIIIDAVEAGSDSGSNGDLDGYNENIAATGIWYAEFDSTKLNDGEYDVNYIVVDVAGNARYYKDTMFVMNNSPTFTSLNLKTDLKGSSVLTDETAVVYVPKRTGSSSTDGFDVQDSALTDDTFFKSVNYLMSIGYNVTGENGGIVYHLEYTVSGTDYTASSDDTDNLPTGVTWDSTEKAFVLSGSTCAPLANNGNVTFTLWVEDSLGLPSAEKTFTVAMENVDEVSPVGQLLEFNTKAYEAFADYAVDQNEDGDVDDEDWAVYQLSSLNSGSWDKTIGHIEPRNTLTSTYATVNPTLSGKVWIRGQVLDNQKIVSIKLNIDGTTYTVAEWDSTAKKLVAAANVNGTTELHQIQDQEGHFAEFAYLWDTSSISAVAKVGTTIKLLVTDASDRTSTAGSYTSSENTSRTTRNRFSFESWGYAQTDVDVRPYITRIDTALSNASSGAPSTFNRSASGRFPVRQGETITVHGFNLDSDSATINGTSVTPTTVSGERVLRYTVPSSNSVALTLKLGEVEAVNNINDNTKAYNLDKNNVTTGISAASNNDNLTDDRVLQIWKFTTVVSDTTIRYPTMRVGKDSDQTVGFAYDSGAQSYKMYLSSTLAGNSDFVTDYSFSQWYDTSVAIDTNGKIYGVSQNGDSGGTGEMSNDGRANSYFYAWNTKNDPDTVRIYHSSGWNSGYRDSSPNGSSYAAYSKGKKKRAIENAYNGSTFNSQRVVNPKIATGDDGVYLVYYDSSSDQVRFRYGTVTGSAYDSGFTGGLVNHDNSNYGSAENYQVVAGNTSSSTPTNNGDIKNNVGKAGEYVAVGVVPKEKTGTEKDVAVVAWYDASNTQLLFSYNTNATDTNNAAQWGTNTMPIDSNFAGWYVDMAVDAAGGIHIAYYGASSGDLRYAYLEDYDDDTPTVVTVDSYLSVGTNISIDVSSETKTLSKPDGTTKSMYIPYISYYMSAFTKTSFSNRVAWLEKLDANGLPADGVSSEKFIGNWEVATIPTSQVPLDYSVGVGIKNNGTVNAPILGYGTKTGLETAQLMDSE